jgi:hypothetical protein
MVGKPAEPTAAPGGSVAAAAWVAGAGDAVAGVDEEPELDAEAVADDPWLAEAPEAPEALAPPAAAVAAGAGAGAGPWPPPPETFSEVKSIREECATD